MYVKLLAGNLAKRRQRLWRWMRENRSSVLALLAVGALLVFLVGYIAHLHGRFRRLKTELKAMGTTQVELPPMPGGQEAVVMQRTLLAEGTTPEFLSATLLPGRGLNVLQIMLSVPGRGAIPLLAAPSLEDAAKLMPGVETDANGVQSLRLGSPIEAPWGGFVSGAPGIDPAQISAVWHGRPLFFPVNDHEGETALSRGGLLLKTEADSVKQNVLPDGGTVQGSFVASNFGGRWPSQTSISVTALLSSRAFDLKLVARNEGKEPVPFGLGWRPQLLFPGGTRTGVKLRLPAEGREEIRDGRATGKLSPVSGTSLDFTDRAGKLLRDLDLDDTFVDLRSGFLDNGPVLELRDPRSGIGIRMTAMTPQVRAVHVHSARGDNKITIGFQTNYDDPFSRVWASDDFGGINVLQPGQTLQWRIRMEVFATSENSKPTL
jgi:aldose 1-epimerase